MSASASAAGSDPSEFIRVRRARAAGTTAIAGATAIACVLASGCVHPRLEPASLNAGRAGVELLPAEFALLSWNTHKQRDPRFEAELARFATDVELLLLQEATEAEPVWSLLPSAHAWTLVVAFEYGRDELATGVATGSAATPMREQALLSPHREPLTCTSKSALVTWVELEGDGGSLVLVNLHGINFRRAAALDAQLRTLDELLEAHSGPAVVAGDFNTWSRARREVVEAFALRHRLRSPFANVADLRFDNVYVRGLTIIAAEVLPSRSSDHDALRVELAIPRAR
jgi:endonuclease/exonuclease/phosphatase (EEP) superfamily protein YafD